MRIARSILVAAAALTWIAPAALAAAEQVQGKIVKLDKSRHEITLQRQAPSGMTTGAASAPTDQYRLDNEPSFNMLRVGDQVTLKVENGTVTQVISR